MLYTRTGFCNEIFHLANGWACYVPVADKHTGGGAWRARVRAPWGSPNCALLGRFVPLLPRLATVTGSRV